MTRSSCFASLSIDSRNFSNLSRRVCRDQDGRQFASSSFWSPRWRGDLFSVPLLRHSTLENLSEASMKEGRDFCRTILRSTLVVGEAPRERVVSFLTGFSLVWMSWSGSRHLCHNSLLHFQSHTSGRTTSRRAIIGAIGVRSVKWLGSAYRSFVYRPELETGI